LYRIALLAIFVLLYPSFAMGQEIQVLNADVNFRTDLQRPGVYSGDYLPRIIVRHANINFRTKLEQPGFPSGDAPPRIIVRHADVNFRTGFIWTMDEYDGQVTVRLTKPSSDTAVTQGEIVSIEWTGTGPAGSSVSLSRDDDNLVNNSSGEATIAASLSVSGSYSWDTTSVSPGTYYIAGQISTSDGAQTTYDCAAGTVTIEPSGVAERTLSITSVEAAPGTSATVHITITDASDMAGAYIVVKYDASVLTLDGVEYTGLASSLNPTANTGTPGEIVIGMASSAAITSGSGALVDIKLTVDPNAQVGTETALSLEEAEIYDELGDVIPTSSKNGIVKITEPGIRGDVNRDGEVSAL
jgi:hypothetical protein